MKRRSRQWTKGKLLKEPQKHPILTLWDNPEILKIMKRRGEEGLHFNDMRFLLCKDFKQIKRPPADWKSFSANKLKKTRIYNDYTILQKDLTKLCEIGFLKKEARGYYIHVERPMMRYIRDIDLSGKNLIGTTDECDILATDEITLSDDLGIECEILFKRIMDARGNSFKHKILNFWKDVDSSKLDIQQKVLLRSELYPFTSNDILKKFIRKECQITTKKGKETLDIPPFRKRDAEKLSKYIDATKKHSNNLGNYSVKYAMGMYTYPNIFTEDYIAKKGPDFKDELELYIKKVNDLLVEFSKPCYVLLAPKQ